jgi:hypothetical protein
MPRAADARRIERLVLLEPGEEIRACARAWVSHPTRLGMLTEGRVRAAVAVTDDRLIAHAVGFWTRRPRTRVILERRADLRVEPTSGRDGTLRVTRPDGTAWILAFGSGPDALATVRALRGAAAAEAGPIDLGDAPPDPGDVPHDAGDVPHDAGDGSLDPGDGSQDPGG